MDATFLQKLKNDYPEFCFREGARFAFRFPRTIIVDLKDKRGDLLALHELGHALLRHRDFTTSVERVKMERAAWDKARELATFYMIPFDEELAEEELDSYREWLDKKSRCPKCGLTRFQTPDGAYHCPRCENFA